MKNISILLLILLCTSVVFGVFVVGINSTYSPSIFMKSVPTETININKLSFYSISIDTDFYFNNNFGLKLSNSLTLPLAYYVNIFGDKENTELKYLYDVLLGVEYRLTYPAGITTLEVFGNISGGLSVFDFYRLSELGYIIVGNIGIAYNIKNYNIQISIGCSYRNYYIENVFGKNNLHMINIPISFGVRYKLP